ncbi:type IV minor pilin protein PilW [Ferrigenium kumadai]|uniref:Type IV minor pilin protein PilW n=1 Tax=Ferrigenium kumadai TaxID=1682490 RepID=A0AAN1VZA7_9PROT|nr:PilW family protein [Ferrigenium kumadai]BBI98331.1 type IV minor pilin protein PilW [Ferrigenium kumadai]
MKTSFNQLPKSRFGVAGYSLVEMMVSITIGLVIVAALIGVLTSNSRSSKTNDRTAELQSNGRYALDHLRRELRHAGYRGYTWAEPNTPTITGITNECLDGGAANSFVVNLRQGIWGADNNPYSANCLSGATAATIRLRGDILVIRRLASAPTATADLTANTLYFRSAYAAGQVFQGTVEPSIPGTPVNNFALQEYVYYIGSDDNDTTVPALRRVALSSNGAMADEMVVSGIEHMQVQYGRTTSDLNTRYYDANAMTGKSTDSAQTEWDDINSVRIWLLARNAKPETGYSNTSSYAMGSVTYGPVSDNFRRQLFTAVVQLRN